MSNFEQKKASFFIPTLLGGLLLGLLSAIPYISILCCIWVPLGGYLAAYMYFKDGGSLRKGNGAFAGFLAGLWGVLISTTLITIMWSLMSETIMSQFYNNLSTSGQDIPQESIAMFEMLFNNKMYMIGASLISYLIVNSLFATLGGLIASGVHKRDNDKTVEMNYQPPQNYINPQNNQNNVPYDGSLPKDDEEQK